MKYWQQCIDCKACFDIRRKIYRCDQCAGLLDIRYEFPSWDAQTLKETFLERRRSPHPLDRSGVWRFRELLPFAEEDLDRVVTLGEGNTSVLEAPQSAEFAGAGRLRVKHLGWNPSGSSKDYGMTLAVSQAMRLGSRVIGCASTGNTSAAMAAYCARAQIEGVVFVPEGQIAYGKLSQALDYGSRTLAIAGNFDQAMRLVQELSAETDLYLVNSINPFRLEGQKLVMAELLEQLEWQLPDRIVVPGGNLGNSSSFGKGLYEMRQLGLIDRLPHVDIIQAEGAAPLFHLLRDGDTELRPVSEPTTLATAIKIGHPVSWKKALRTLHWTGGLCEAVSEQEIADAKAVLGRDGIGCEPASAASLAGVRKLIGARQIDAQAEIVLILTGHQLKDPNYTVDYHLDRLATAAGQALTSQFGNRPLPVAADREQIKALLNL